MLAWKDVMWHMCHQNQFTGATCIHDEEIKETNTKKEILQWQTG